MQDEAIERALGARRFAVIVHVGDEFPSNDVYRIMEKPNFITQIGGDFDFSDAANEVCERLNTRAAISAYLADVPVSEAMVEAELGEYEGDYALKIKSLRTSMRDTFKAMCAKLSEELSNAR